MAQPSVQGERESEGEAVSAGIEIRKRASSSSSSPFSIGTSRNSSPSSSATAYATAVSISKKQEVQLVLSTCCSLACPNRTIIAYLFISISLGITQISLWIIVENFRFQIFWECLQILFLNLLLIQQFAGNQFLLEVEASIVSALVALTCFLRQITPEPIDSSFLLSDGTYQYPVGSKVFYLSGKKVLQ